MYKPKSPLIFIVEDNKAYRSIVEQHLKINKYEHVTSFDSGEECLKNLYQKPDIIIQDYILQGINGLSVLQRTKKVLPNTEFIFLSGKENIEIAVNTLKSGAFDYIVKNALAMQHLLYKIENVVQIQNLKRRNKRLRIFIAIFLLFVIILVALIFLALHYEMLNYLDSF